MANFWGSLAERFREWVGTAEPSDSLPAEHIEAMRVQAEGRTAHEARMEQNRMNNGLELMEAEGVARAEKTLLASPGKKSLEEFLRPAASPQQKAPETTKERDYRMER